MTFQKLKVMKSNRVEIPVYERVPEISNRGERDRVAGWFIRDPRCSFEVYLDRRRGDHTDGDTRMRDIYIFRHGDLVYCWTYPPYHPLPDSEVIRGLLHDLAAALE